MNEELEQEVHAFYQLTNAVFKGLLATTEEDRPYYDLLVELVVYPSSLPEMAFSPTGVGFYSTNVLLLLRTWAQEEGITVIKDGMWMTIRALVSQGLALNRKCVEDMHLEEDLADDLLN